MNTPQTDTPETDAQGYGNGSHPYVPTDFARTLERRAIAAEARVKELEAANTVLQRSKEWYEREAIRQTAAKEDYERQLRASLRLRRMA